MNQDIKGIYIHVPFCKSKCNYCSFYSVARPSELLKENYITRLIEEITNSKWKAPKLSTVYIGGGTPSLLNINSLTQIVTALENKFKIKIKNLRETTIEINPGTVDYEYLKALKELGFNRISVGLETLNDYILEGMGRAHTSQESIKTLELLEELGFENITVDLMFNYPKQTINDVEEDINRLLNFNCIKHFSIYSTTVEEGTKLYYQVNKGISKLNDDEVERKTYYRIREHLEKNGFYQYEISNFSKPGYESFHNTLYWNRDNYLSFGPASSASIGDTLIDYPADLNQYIKNGNKSPEIRILSKDELKEDFMIFGLRKTNGIYDINYKRMFNSSFFDDFKDEIERLIDKKLIQKIPDGIKLTTLGIDFYNQVALNFLK